MKKVLLATTALVVVGGITTAASADITVTGAAEFKHTTWSDDSDNDGGPNKTNMGTTTSFKITADRALDNGLMLSGYTGQDGSTGAFDDHGFAISGDFGTLGFAGSESGDAFATSTDVTPDEGNTISSSKIALPADEHLSGADISYLSPNVSGFQFSIGLADDQGQSDTNLIGAKYSMSSMMDTMVTIQYAQQSGGETVEVTNAAGAVTAPSMETDATSLGIKLDYGKLSAVYARNTKDVTETSMGMMEYAYEADSFGVTYGVTDNLSLSAYTGKTEDDNDGSHELKDTGYGVSYTVTPGLVVHLTHNEWDLKDMDFDDESGDHTALAINVSF